MKPHKSTILISLLSLLLFAFVAVSAQQTPAQGEQNKAESCCTGGSCCCCSGDSCDMSKHENHKMKGDGSCCNMKQKDAKDKTATNKTAKKV